GDVIDFAGLTATGLVYSGGTLTLTNGGTSVGSVTLAGNFLQSDFTLGSDGAGGSLVGLTSPTNLLVNGGFEQSTSNLTTPPGWTNIGHTDGVIAYSQFINQPVFEGAEFYDLGGFGGAGGPLGDGIEQAVATVP